MEGSAVRDRATGAFEHRSFAWDIARRLTVNEHFATYRQFWTHYLREHAKPKTRALHFLGTVTASAALLALVVTRRLWLIPFVLVGGYGPAWFGHFFIEKNRPATFTHPFWSLFSDYRMAFLWLRGRLPSELARAGISQR